MGVARFPVRFRSRSLLSPLLSNSRFREISACGVDPVVTRDRSQSRLGRAHAPRGRSGGDRRSVSTDICNPQDLFSNDEPRVSFTPNRDSHAIREPPVLGPAIRFGEPAFSSAGVPLTSDRSFAAGGGTSPALAYRESREPSVGSERLRLPCALPEENAKKASAVFSTTLGHFSRPWSPLLAPLEATASSALFSASVSSAFTREARTHWRRRADGMNESSPHPRHRCATLEGRVDLRIHAAIQIRSRESGAFHRRHAFFSHRGQVP